MSGSIAPWAEAGVPRTVALPSGTLVYGGRWNPQPDSVGHWWTSEKRCGVKVIVSTDDGQFGPQLHMSISHRSRLPYWHEVKAAREALLPLDKDFMMILPRPENYVNLHEFCFHLWETPVAWEMR